MCTKFRNPVGIITKSALIRKDLDVLLALKERSSVQVIFSIPFYSDELSRKLEPGAPRSSTRFRAMKTLSEAGIAVGVGVAPVIPGLSDQEIPDVLEKAKECGASFAFMTLLRLPAEVKEVFTSRIQEQIPERAQKIFGSLKGMRNGLVYNNQFGKRMSGEGERWKAVEWLFDRTCEKLGLNLESDREERRRNRSTFERPQLRLPGF